MSIIMAGSDIWLPACYFIYRLHVSEYVIHSQVYIACFDTGMFMHKNVFNRTQNTVCMQV